MPQQPQQVSHNVSRLKELLFDRENATLAELQGRIAQVANAEQLNRQELTQALQASVAAEAANRVALAQRVDSVFDRAGSEERFRSSVAEVLDGALRDAEVNRHDQLARAMAPLVVKTIKTELRNSQDEMVEALYPITGRLVKSYVASAMKDLMVKINRRLAGGSNPFMLRLRSQMTGRSVAELALAETQQLEVVELFLIRRGSGELIQHWPEGPQGAGGLSNSNIHLSGVLTAINDFAGQALKDDGGNLRSFSLDDFQMYLRGSQAYLLAAKCRGAAPAGVEATLDDEFLRLIDRNRVALATADETVPPPLLDPLAQSLEARLEEQQQAMAAEAGLGFNPLKAIAIAAAVPLLLFIGWTLYTNYETTRVRDIATATIADMSQLAGYPTQVDVAPRGREVTLTGLVPTATAKADIIGRLRSKLPSSTVVDRLAALPNQLADFEPQVSRVRRDLAGIEGEAFRSSVRRALARANRHLEQTLPQLRRLDLALTDEQARSTAQSVGSNVERVSVELRQLQARVEVGPVDVGQLGTMSAPMHTLSERLKQASVELSTLLSRGSSGIDAAHSDAAPADVLESAEELSLSAEQLVTVAVAVTQSAGIRPPPALPQPAIEPSTRDRLEKWTRSNAVFFGEGTEFRAAQSVQASLDAAAKLIRDARVLVRVVGYTDERGAQTRNNQLAQSRAQRVVDALIERGVPRQLLVAIGRPTGIDISPAVGAQSPNRRVEFELGFDGETNDQP
jgi:outer membrane protein OmpA-like peptidoglycan-associated protein